MNRIVKTFLTGLVAGIPIIITIWVIWSVGVWLNGLAVAGAAKIHEPAGTAMEKIPGLGIVAVLVLIFLLGAAARFWLIARLISLLEQILQRVPLVKTIYTSLRDMLRFFGGGKGAMGKVALYKVPDSPVRMLAIVTNEQPVGLPSDQNAGMVAIWLPMSYMLGGYMLYVPANSVEPIDMSVEQVMKLATTAEVGARALATDKPPR
ncbi:MAG: DUF502 domain-containing protein [Planctomycetes bacterium]|nr:DUF502 domain-containing protein [Planctomycetota bacterium]